MAGRKVQLSSKGQSTLEYVVILTAIIAAIIFAATTFMRPRVSASLDHVTNEMNNQVNLIKFGDSTPE